MATFDLPGRGTDQSPPNRFEELRFEPDPDLEPDPDDDGPPPPPTRLYRDASRSVLAENSSPDVGFRFSVNPYRGCEHGCVYCLDPATPILHADMSWRPIGAVQVGDVLAGFDEHPAPGATRNLRTSVVEHVLWSRRPTVRMTTAQTEVVTTAEHRWLRAGELGWSETGDLAPGQLLQQLPPMHGPLAEGPLQLGPDPIVSLEHGPTRDVVDIQTSTRTFFAAGLATHNCYARPSHEYLGWNAGLDFETRLLVKDDAPELLRRHLASPRWQPEVIALSGNTDCYQPVERRLKLTRGVVEVLRDFRNPVGVITKSALVARDADLLGELAQHGAAHVRLSVTTLDPELARRMEPRAATPERRLQAIARLAEAGVPVGVMVAPVIPGLNDVEIPRILEAAARAGAANASWVLLRLASPLDELFTHWLARHYPEKRDKVLNRIRETRAGRLNDSTFGKRMRGDGEYAQQIALLFAATARKHGLAAPLPPLRTDAFRRPPRLGDQLSLL